ncbi:MAG TPA: cbb3-type cytochrome c oxidase subunit I [bacterium]|nr:cbb3-type cytochrome c oxidase subunit I [bacterium]
MLTRQDSVRWYFLGALIFLPLGVTYGLFSATHFINPAWVEGMPWLQFGRMRPVHIHLVAFGWLSMAYVGAMYYMVPKMCKTPLWSDKLGKITAVAHFAWVWAAVFCLSNGISEGREYAEAPWFLDYVFLVYLLAVATNIFMTIANRRQKRLYVSIWYFTGTLIWFPCVYILGNRAFLRLDGLNDAIANWFYGHNILGLWFTTVGVGMAYYLLPLLIRRPIYSHKLSMIGFWAIALFYAPVGTHHILQSPVPYWLKSLSVVASIGLLVPVLTVLFNFFLTLDKKWPQGYANYTLRFLMTGMVNYLFTCTQGPFQATRWVNWYIHFTQWVVAHAHIALLGTFSYFSFAAIYYIVPRLVGRPIFSRPAMAWHWWLTTIGFTAFFWALTIAGLVTSAGWRYGMPQQQWVQASYPEMVVRWIGGVMIVVGQYIFVWNIFRTLYTPVEVEVAETPAPQALTQAA